MKLLTFQRVFSQSSAPDEGMVGDHAATPDGRIWIYSKASEAITKHMIASRPANTTVTSVSSSTNSRSQSVYITKASAGWTVGAYQNAWVAVNTGTGTGQVAKIKDNTADTLELYEDYALSTALTTAGSSGIAIVLDNQVEKVPITVKITPVVGVAQISFTSGYYGYFLKRGVGGVLAGEAITISENITPGDDTEGEGILGITAKGPFDAANVGRCLVANSAADLAALIDVGAA
jgi:hypothetical protein